MTRLWLVRHGPTHAKEMIGWTDRPADLSDTAALARLSAYLPDAPVISSDLLRARATADAIQGDRSRLTHDPDLRELHFGDWEARSWAEVDAEDPENIRAFWESPGDIAPPGGESWNALRRRVDGAINRLPPEPDLIVVCHFGAILTQLQRALSLETTEAFGHKIDNLSVTRVQIGAGLADPINHNP